MGKHTRAEHYLVLGYLRPIFDYLRDRGQSLRPYLQILGLHEDDLTDVDRRLPDSALVVLLQLAETELRDPHVGLHIGYAMQLHHLGIVGMLVTNARRISEVLDLHARYQCLIGNALRTRYERTGKEICMRVEPMTRARFGDRHSYEYILGIGLRLRDMLLGNGLPLNRIELPFERPAAVDGLQTVLPGPISFGHEALLVAFDAHYGDVELRVSDPELKQVLELHARQRLRQLQGEQLHDDPVIADIRQMITERLPYGPPSIEDIAQRMGVSVRKMQRMLSHQQLTYKGVMDQLRCELAKRYVNDARLTLIDVAMMLGFTEQSSFTRAFRRWYDKSPGDYRRLCRTA
jgi:AraC-like DNA-binding protein